VSNKFEGDSMSMREHMAVYDLQSADDWLGLTKSSNLNSHVCCVVFETRMVSIQERIKTPWMGVLCGLRPKPRNVHTIVSWSRIQNPMGPWHWRTKADGSQEGRKSHNFQNRVRMWPYGVWVLGVKRCFGNSICTITFPKSTPIWWWPLLLCQVSQCTRMKEIISRVSSRIREKRWLPSVSRMTRTHMTVIVHFSIDVHNKNEVVCMHESIFTWICIHIYIYYKWKNPIIYIWTRGLRKECAFCGRGLNKQELWRKCFNNILFGSDNPGVCTSKFNNKLFHILLNGGKMAEM